MELAKGPAEQRLLLRNISWETYERLVSEREERPVPRFFYDRGVLEIVSPSKGYEPVSRVVALLVEELAVELDIDVESAGSTTFKREDRARGFDLRAGRRRGSLALRRRTGGDVRIAQRGVPL